MKVYRFEISKLLNRLKEERKKLDAKVTRLEERKDRIYNGMWEYLDRPFNQIREDEMDWRTNMGIVKDLRKKVPELKHKLALLDAKIEAVEEVLDINELGD